MISNLRPLGALLAALTFWALGLLLLSLAGLGGQAGPHPDNAALMPAMPVVTLDTVGPRLGPASNYLEAANRPLLSQDRQPPAIVAESGGDSEAPLEVNLTSVLITSGMKLAILQGKEDGVSRRVKLGDVLAGTAWRLVELEPRRAVFDGPQGRRELELRVFDGTGGVPPTPQVGLAPSPGPPGIPRNEVKREDVAGAATPAPTNAPVPDPNAAPMTPDQQVEAIRRRIEARRAMRAAEANQERPPSGTQQQVQ